MSSDPRTQVEEPVRGALVGVMGRGIALVGVMALLALWPVAARPAVDVRDGIAGVALGVLGAYSIYVRLAAWHAGQTLMGAVDTAVVGRLGAAEIAAVGLGNAIFMGAFIMSMGVMMGLDPLISQALGAKQHARASQLVWHGGVLALLLTVLLMPLLFSTGALLRWAGIEDATAALTHNYVVWRTPGDSQVHACSLAQRCGSSGR